MRIPAARGALLRSATSLAGAVLAAACTAGTGTPAAGSPPAARQAAAAPAGACGLPLASTTGPAAGRIVLGGISIASGAAVHPAVRVDQGWWRYWQKTGLEIRAGSQAVTITVPRAWRARAAITWGVNTGIVSRLRLPGCRAARGTWNAYAGGIYLRSSSACVPLVFGVGQRSAVIKVGVGRHC
jgi:hypothetical protein